MIELVLLSVLIMIVIFSVVSCICLLSITQFFIKAFAVTKIAFAFLVCVFGVLILLILGYIIRTCISLVTHLIKKSDFSIF